MNHYRDTAETLDLIFQDRPTVNLTTIAKGLGCKTQTLRRKLDAAHVPFYSDGGSRRSYDRRAIRIWLASLIVDT
jgi:hypothetical protein